MQAVTSLDTHSHENHLRVVRTLEAPSSSRAGISNCLVMLEKEAEVMGLILAAKLIAAASMALWEEPSLES